MPTEDELKAALGGAVKQLEAVADKCDRWAEQSQSGGWSTHQVHDNRRTADSCRRIAARLRASL
jgi:hypothetical protein